MSDQTIVQLSEIDKNKLNLFGEIFIHVSMNEQGEVEAKYIPNEKVYFTMVENLEDDT